MTYEILRRKSKKDLIDILIRESQEQLSGVSESLKALWTSNIDYSQENFILLCLDHSNNLLKRKVLFKGGLTSANIDLRILFYELLTTKRCSRFIVAHNHPSGTLHPSKQDLQVTKRIKEAGKLFSLDLLDHMIITETRYFSFLEEGVLQ